MGCTGPSGAKGDNAMATPIAAAAPRSNCDQDAAKAVEHQGQRGCSECSKSFELVAAGTQLTRDCLEADEHGSQGGNHTKDQARDRFGLDGSLHLGLDA